MSFTSVGFMLFLPLAVLVYYFAPARRQNTVLFALCVIFYWFNLPQGSILSKNIMPLIVLFASSFYVYWLAKRLGESGRYKKALLVSGICSLIAVLAVFKYSGAIIPVLFGPDTLLRLAFPLGISFYTFRSISYLTDVYRGDLAYEKSYVSYFVYTSFFASVASGPISRAKDILPQLAQPKEFNVRSITSALQMALVGFFKQLAIANIIGLSINVIFDNTSAYGGATLLIAAFLYAFQLYFEFSGYSDIAVAVGKIFGLELMQNFKTPYFSTSFSAFWSRWHISLSSWLQDYIFMPLVWGRWTSQIPFIGKKVQSPPMISSVILLFLISGLWHGNTLCFVIWGLLMGLYRAGEELLHKYYKKPKKKPGLGLRIFKTGGVFLLWSAGLVFFRMGTVQNGAEKAVYIFKSIFTSFFATAPAADFSAAIQTGFYPKAAMVPVYLLFALLVLCVGIFADWYQCFKLRDKHISAVFVKMPLFWRWLCYYALTGAVMASYIMQSGGYGGTVQAPYAGF